MICDKEEHEHSIRRCGYLFGWLCGEEAHKHSWQNGCYELTCTKPVHAHTNACYYKRLTTITRKYDASITDVWTTGDVKKALEAGYVFKSSLTGYKYSFLEKMPSSDVVMTQTSFGSGDKYEWYYWLETLNGVAPAGKETTSHEGKTYYKHHMSKVVGSGVYLTYNEDYYPITGFTQKDREVPSFSYDYELGNYYSGKYTADLYYLRDSFTLTRNNHGSVASANSYLFEQQIPETEQAAPSRPTGLSASYTFQGWYSVPVDVVKAASAEERDDLKFDFTQTMPAKDLIIYAYWEAENVSLNIGLTIGSSQTTHSGSHACGTKIADTDEYKTAMQEIATAGLVVAYWADANGNSVDVNQGLSSDMTIHPVYANATDSYHVYYKKADGNAYATDDYTYQSGAAAEAVQPTGIDNFLYWQIGNDTTKYYPGAPISISNADVTLTAVCGTTRGTTTLTYHSNFGTDTTYTDSDIEANSVVTIKDYSTITTLPANSGYSFLGWATSSDGTVVYDAGDTVLVDELNANTANHLYAVWAADITVTFVVEHGTWDEKAGDEATRFSVTIPYNTALTAAQIPMTGETVDATPDTGYAASGAWKDSKVPNTTTQLTESTTYTYTFGTQIKYKVTYKVDGVQDGTVETYNYGDEVTLRGKPTKENYTVSDWSVPSDITVTDGKFSMPAEDVVITATSSINTASYTINYYLDDVHQTGDTETGTANINSTVTASKTDKYSSYLEYTANQTKSLTISSNSSANVLNLYYYTDEEGDDNGGNQYPDIYEKKVTFKIVNGTWNGTDANDRVEWIKLYAADGVTPSSTGTGSLSEYIPSGMQPNSNYAASSGAWDVTPPMTVTGTDDATYTFGYSTVLAANLTVAKTVYSIKRGDTYIYGGTSTASTIPYVQTDDVIVWQIEVQNTGNAAGSVTLVDKLNSTTQLDIYTDTTFAAKVTTAQTIAAGATVNYYVTYTVLSTDTGRLTNSVKVNDEEELIPSDSINVGQAELSVKKYVHSINGQTPSNLYGHDNGYGYTSVPTVKVGDKIIWGIEVTNRGTADGTFTLTDELLGVDCVFYHGHSTTDGKCVLSNPVTSWPQTIDDRGAAEVHGDQYYVEYTIQESDIGKTLFNKVTLKEDGKTDKDHTAPGVPVGGLTVEKIVGVPEEIEFEPIVPSPDQRAAATTSEHTAKVGETITWTITVKNYYDTDQTFTLVDTLSNGKDVTLTPAPDDGKYTIDAAGKNADGSIKPTVMTITATYEVQESDEGSTLVNKVKVTPTGGTPIGDDAPGVEVEGKLSVSKKVATIKRGNDTIYDSNKPPKIPEAKIGDQITWEITVSNTGNATIQYTLADALEGRTGLLTIYNKDRDAEIGAEDNQTLEPREEETAVPTSNTYYVDYTVKTSDYSETLINVVTVTEKTDDGSDKTHTDKAEPIEVEDKPNTPSYNPNYNAGVQLEKGEHFNYVIGYSDGTVRPEGNITRAEVATIFFRLLTDESRKTYLTEYNTFTDVEKSMWHNVAISTLARAGVLNGYNDGSFRPDNNITRAEMAAIISRFAELEGSTRISFTDIKGHWAEKSILLAASNGWINGYNDGSFRPDQNITRAETFAMINRVLERKVEHVNDLVSDMNTWVDNMDTTQWYYFDVQEATNYHSYERKYTNTKAEKWIKKLTDIDWTVYQY